MNRTDPALTRRVFLLGTNASAAPDPNFYIYLSRTEARQRKSAQLRGRDGKTASTSAPNQTLQSFPFFTRLQTTTFSDQLMFSVRSRAMSVWEPPKNQQSW